MKIRKECQLLVVSGPSGAGKTTLIQKMLQKHPEVLFSISHTTRHPRRGEEEGKNYYYVSRDKFLSMIAAREFVEWAEVHNNLYGTTLMEIKIKSALCSTLLLDVDLQGARNIKTIFPEANLLFITPSSIATLVDRLKARSNEADFDLQKRLQTAKTELKEAEIFDFLIRNDNLEEAFCDLENLVSCFNLKISHNEDFFSRLFKEIDGYDFGN